MVGVEDVPQAEGVREATQSKLHRVTGRDEHDHDAPADQMQQRDAAKQAGQTPRHGRHRDRPPASKCRSRRRHPSMKYRLLRIVRNNESVTTWPREADAAMSR